MQALNDDNGRQADYIEYNNIDGQRRDDLD
jgi:hypothetical protein